MQEGGGSGLGLSIVNTLVQLHGQPAMLVQCVSCQSVGWSVKEVVGQ